jgi:poly-gamma-glutamate synthesis protein (capsule biosynthesis protein)
VCVSIHWGHEYFQYPSPAQIETAHTLADAGATFIISHHPHVIQGIEKYKNAIIMYSLGNFFFSSFRSMTGRLQYQKPLTREFMIVCSDFSESETIGYDLLGGTVNEDYCLIPFVGDDQQRFIQKESSLSHPIIEPNYDKFWESYKSRREQELLRENFIEAFRKLSRMSLRDFLTTIGPNDIIRIIGRFFKILFKAA